MNSLDPIMDHIARNLLSVSWQVSLLMLLVWIISLITRKSSSEFRYWLWMIVLVRLCIPVGLEIPVSIPTADDLLKEPVLSLVQAPPLLERDTAVPSRLKITETSAKSLQPLVPRPGETSLKQFSIHHLIAFIWLAGIVVIGLAIVWRVTRLGRRLRVCPPILMPDVQFLLAQLKRRMNITQLVELFYLDLPAITSPAVSGVFHPRIYLPRSMVDSWPLEDLEPVLLHELAHIHRYDAVVNWLQLVLQTIYFFHPLVWLANWEIRQLREEVCDDLAIHHYAFKKERYTQGIINVLKNRMREPALTFLGLGFIERKLSLSERVRRIMNDGYTKYSRLTVTSVLILSAIGLLSISLSSAKSSTDEGGSVRQLNEGLDVGKEGAISPDGRYLSYVDWENGDLAVYEIATGKKRRVTHQDSWEKTHEYAFYSRWSLNGKQIVYDWFTAEGIMELRLIGLDGSKPRILYSNKENFWAQTYGWSPDGKHILACITKKNGPTQIVLVSVADGSVRVLKTLDRRPLKDLDYPGPGMCFSPDGRYVVYDFRQQEDALERDIYLLTTDGSREIPLVEHPANEAVLGWTPDGRGFLFTSNRRDNTRDAWVIHFSDGKPQGPPELFRPDMVDGSIGFSPKGSLYYVRYETGRDVYIAELDPVTGKMLAPPEKAISNPSAKRFSPEYSPDGKYLAFITGLTHHPNTLHIYSLETGNERAFTTKLSESIAQPRWSPDGSSILVSGNSDRGWEIYRFETQTGIFTHLVSKPDHGELITHEWSHDGMSFFLVRRSETDSSSQIVLRDITSGTEKELYRTSYDFACELSCSPDGAWLAYMTNGENGVLGIMPVSGGALRELYRFKKDDSPQTLRWTPDGKHILFDKDQAGEKKHGLWRIPMEGGEPQKLGLERPNQRLFNFSVHPDGRHIAFSTTFLPKSAGLWVMDNFLRK